MDFTTKYKLTKNKLVGQPNNYVPRIFPTYSSNPESANFPLYCKYQLLQYKPWVLTKGNAWNNIELSDDVLSMLGESFFRHLLHNVLFLTGSINLQMLKINMKTA